MRVLLSALVLGALSALFVLAPFNPNFPFDGIDPSWVAAMGEAADRPARWGIDADFTYGPASTLFTGYYNAAYFTRTLPLQLGFAALFGWCAALLVASGGTRAAVAGTAACGLMVVAAKGRADAFFLVLPLLVFLLAVRRVGLGGPARMAPPLGAFAMGLTAMVKTSFPLAALPLFVLADGADLARGRVPRLLLPFALGVPAGALLYGQRLADLPTFAALQGEVVAGYAAAMGLSGPIWDLAPFLLLAAGLVALCRPGPGRRGAAGWLVPAGVAVDLLFLLKAGFVRHDLHSLIGWTGLALVATVLARSVLPGRAGRAVTAAACFVVLVYGPLLTVRQSVRDGRGAALVRLYGGWLAVGPPDVAANAWRFVADPARFRSDLDAEKAEAWSDVARAAPLGPLDGTVDVIPSQQSRLLAAGLAYRGRPSFQEYSTYTDGLQAANRAFFEGPDAPRWVLFGPESPLGEMALDARYPGTAEGGLWPTLLRLYRPDHRAGSLAALQRRDTPAALSFGPPRRTVTRFGEPVQVGSDGAVWAMIDLRLNAVGTAVGLLFRPPPLVLDVRVGGVDRAFRLVPALARAGFLLSPLVDNSSDYEVLATGRAAGAVRRVVSVSVEGSRAARWLYGPDIAVTLRDVDTSGLAGPPPERDATAWDALARASTGLGEGAADPGGRIAAAPGVVSLPLAGLPAADGARRVALGFGVAGADGARRACFSIHPADGTRAELWRRCLDPAAEADRGPQTVSLDVPDGVEELALATDAAAPQAPYWSRPQAARAADR